MKDVIYDGSIVDDINLVNDTDCELTDMQKKKKRNWILVILGNIIGVIGGMILGNELFAAISFAIFDSSFAISAYKMHKQRNGRFNKKSMALDHLERLVYNLNNSRTNSKNLVSTISFEDIKESVIVKEEEIVSEPIIEHTLIDEVTEEDIRDYVKVVTSDLYFFNIYGQVKALREVKKIANHQAKRHARIKSIQVQEFEENDYPSYLPVRQVLKLVNTNNENQNN